MNTRLAIAAIAAAICLLVTACGADDGSKSPDSSSGSAASQPLIWDSGQWDNTNWS